jgi:hypothetical protein
VEPAPEPEEGVLLLMVVVREGEEVVRVGVLVVIVMVVVHREADELPDALVDEEVMVRRVFEVGAAVPGWHWE